MPSNIVNRNELHGINIKKEETKNYEKDNYIKGVKRLKDRWSKNSTSTFPSDKQKKDAYLPIEENDNKWREKLKKWLKEVMPDRFFP